MNAVREFFQFLIGSVTPRGTPHNPWRVGDTIRYLQYEGIIVSLDTDEWGRDCAVMKTSTGVVLVVLIHPPPAWRRQGDAQFFEVLRVSVNIGLIGGVVSAAVLLVWIWLRYF